MPGESNNAPSNPSNPSNRPTESSASPSAALPAAGNSPAGQPLRCALTGQEIAPDQAYWAPPLVTVQQLIGTVITTLRTNPGDLQRVLFAEQENVPYAPEAREELAAQRTTEQLKLVGVLLLVVVLILLPFFLLFN